MLRKCHIYRLMFSGLVLVGLLRPCTAQDSLPDPQPVKDTGQVIHLLNADILLGIQGKKGDSSQMQKLIGNVRLKQGGTIFTCDSALRYLYKNTIDAYGHIHINQADTINTYADFLHYEGNTKIATLKNNVKMTDGHMVLTTNYLTYDMNSHIGSYTNGGKLVNQETVLTSRLGYYYADTKDVYFKHNVKLNNPEYTLTTDTLLYNTRSHIATFLAPTAINTGKTVIYTSCGYYNTDEQYTHLCRRPSIADSTGTLTADTLNFSKTTGIGRAFGNVHWTDTAGQVTVESNYAISNRQKQTILATKNPLLILVQKDDSLFVASDTLFSGPVFPETPQIDTTADSLSYIYIKPDNPVVQNYRDSLAAQPDSLRKKIPGAVRGTDSTLNRSLLLPVLPRIPTQDTIAVPTFMPLELPTNSKPKTAQTTDTRRGRLSEEKAVAPSTDTSQVTTAKQDSSQLRNIIAYYHVKLYSDSLQGAADSLYYSDVDSAFHFYGDPVLWTGQTQLTGDTIVLITENQQASRLLLQQNAMIINKVGPDQYNQIKGNIITGYFNDSSQLEWMEVEGNAECIYYAQEDNGAFVGVNHTTSSSIRLFFKDNHLNKVVFYKDVSGTFSNPLEVTKEEARLEGFKWEAQRRPLSKYDLFRIKNTANDTERQKQPETALDRAASKRL